MTVNCPCPIKIVIIDGALIDYDFESKEFIDYVDEEVGDDFNDDHEGENQVDEVADDFKDDHEGEDVVFNCIRQTPSSNGLVVKSAFQQSEEKDDGKETVIFHTFTQIRDKNCKVIVDGGSCINAVSFKMIEKVGLKIVPHLHL